MDNKTIRQLCVEAYNNSNGHGFWDDYGKMPSLCHGPQLTLKYIQDTKLTKIALMHSELGEMTEAVRRPIDDVHCPGFSSEEIELADVLIRAFDYAMAFNLRLSDAKMEYNKTRPFMHGKGA